MSLSTEDAPSIGDVVQLATRTGPRMTVVAYDVSTFMVTAVWLDTRLRKKDLPLLALVPAEPDSSTALGDASSGILRSGGTELAVVPIRGNKESVQVWRWAGDGFESMELPRAALGQPEAFMDEWS